MHAKRLRTPLSIIHQYMVIMGILILVEISVAADVLLNSDWEKDLPDDPTGRFSDFEDFVESNLDVFKGIGLLIILAQGLSILLTMVLRSIASRRGTNNDNDDEEFDFPQAKLPLIKPPSPPYGVVPPSFASLK